MEAVPPQVVLALPKTASRPLGNVSVSAAPVSSVVPALLNVMVRVESTRVDGGRTKGLADRRWDRRSHWGDDCQSRDSRSRVAAVAGSQGASRD